MYEHHLEGDVARRREEVDTELNEASEALQQANKRYIAAILARIAFHESLHQ